jgi:hypothetical protein
MRQIRQEKDHWALFERISLQHNCLIAFNSTQKGSVKLEFEERGFKGQ